MLIIVLFLLSHLKKEEDSTTFVRTRANRPLRFKMQRYEKISKRCVTRGSKAKQLFQIRNNRFSGAKQWFQKCLKMAEFIGIIHYLLFEALAHAIVRLAGAETRGGGHLIECGHGVLALVFCGIIEPQAVHIIKETT